MDHTSEELVVRPGRDASVEIDVQVVPRSSRDRIVGLHGDRLRVQVKAPPVDGAANAGVCALLAAELEIPKRDVAVVRGTSAKRKTVRVAGVSIAAVRERLGLGAVLAALVAATGCPPITTNIDVQVVLPADSSDLERINNATLLSTPNGFTETFAVDGLDFGVEVELDPDDTPRELALFLAANEELLAWGKTPLFQLSGGAIDLALFAGRPGQLSTFPAIVDAPDPAVLAAPALGRGMVTLAPNGATFFLSDRTLTVATAATLDGGDGGVPDPADGTLVGDALGGVTRLAWADSLRGFRFDPALDLWSPIQFAGDIGPRAGAAWLRDASHEHVLVFGGGQAFDVAEIDLIPNQEGVLEAAKSTTMLDTPRVGATAAWVTRSDTDDGESVVVFGTSSPDLPAAFLTAQGLAIGPMGPWVGGRCIQLDIAESAVAAATVRMLCAGGVREDSPTADALVLRFPPVGSGSAPEVEELADLLLIPTADPMWLSDEGAVYAHGEGRLLRVARLDLSLSEPPTSPARASGGQSVTLSTGATYLLGGLAPDGAAVDRWQVFLPQLSP